MASQATARAIEHVERRRSPRLISKVAFVISGESPERQLFQERAFTFSINAHGALLALTMQVTLGQKLLLMNPKTWNRTEGRVIRLGPLQGEWTQVAIEFAQPAPEFCSIGAPPKRSLPGTPKSRSPWRDDWEDTG
jgi:hypothetical protein